MAALLARGAKAALTLLAAAGFDAPDVGVSSTLDAASAGASPFKPAFEVGPPPYRNTKGAPCVVPLAQHEFAYSYGTPFSAAFAPVTACDAARSVVYLKWVASSPLGVQFDRIAAVWVNGVELLRTSTEEPDRKSGVAWAVAKDVSLYADVLRRGGDVVVALDNVLDGPYNSSFTVTLTAEFFAPLDAAHAPRRPDLVVPVSKGNASYGWFTVEPGSVAAGANGALVQVPRNTEELYLELFLSHHQCDEFWYGNPPSDFAQSVGACGGGPFREVQVLVDGALVGVVWPFPLLFTGGLNPYLWRPIVAIGAFDAPTYVVNLTPFVGTFVDGKPHNVTFFVDYGIDFWPIDGNLLVYVDAQSEQTVARVLAQQIDARVTPVASQHVDGVNANFTLVASRELRVTSSVATSKGTTIYDLHQSFRYANVQEYRQDGEVGTFDATTVVKTTLTVVAPASSSQQQQQQQQQQGGGGGGGGGATTLATVVHEEEYPLTGRTFYRQFADGTYRLEADLSNAFRRALSVSGNGADTLRFGFASKDVAAALQGSAQAQSGLGGNGTTEAAYSETSALDGCFSRRAAATNGVVREDESSTDCEGVASLA